MEEIIKLASEIYMIALCLLVGPANQKEVRVDLVGTRGLIDTLIAERTDEGFAVYDERNRGHVPFLTLERRADKAGVFVAKGPKGQKDTVDLSAELARLDGLDRRTKLVFKTEHGSEILLARSGAITYLTESRSDRTYAVHAGGQLSARRRAGLADLSQVTTNVYPLRYSDPKKVAEIIKQSYFGRADVAVDERTRSLVVTARPETQEALAHTLAQLDVEER